MIVLSQEVEACVVVSQQQVCCVGMWSLWVGLLIDAWMGPRGPGMFVRWAKSG